MMFNRYKTEFLQHRDSLYRFAYGMLKHSQDAEDVVQDTYERLDKQINKGTRPVNLKSYLFMIVRNLCLDKINAKKDFTDQDIQIPEYDSMKEYENKDMVEVLNHFLSTLPTLQRTVIILKDIEGFEYDEISILLKKDLNNIRVNLSIARKKVRKHFEKQRGI